VKLATWNVNSLKVRLQQLIDWLGREQPDVICLQETKTEDASFPAQQIREAGFEPLYSGQKTYNGVALLTRAPAVEVVTAIPGLADDQKRVLAATVAGLRVICIYVPNGESVDSPKYRYKLSWLQALQGWLREELARYPRLAVLGDYNIAPEERDVHDARLWEGKVLFSEPERAAFRDLLNLGLQDSFRMFEQSDKSFTWWDYRMNAFKRNLGLRIDHILLSEESARRASGSRIEKAIRAQERPSDHVPVITELRDD